MPSFHHCNDLQASSLILKDLIYHILPYLISFVFRFYLSLKMANYLIKVLSLILCAPYCAFHILLVLPILLNGINLPTALFKQVAKPK